ncbi:MAG: sodium:proton antiporter [Opitutaceae bacterium]|nr:sodium:proton antiporter [Opitutaceae bacterium]
MTIFIYACIALSMIATLLCLWRMAAGPTTLDRILAFDGIVIATVAMMVLFSIYWRTAQFIELIVIIASLGFLTTVAFYYFLSRQPPEAALGRDEARKGGRK